MLPSPSVQTMWTPAQTSLNSKRHCRQMSSSTRTRTSWSQDYAPQDITTQQIRPVSRPYPTAVQNVKRFIIYKDLPSRQLLSPFHNCAPAKCASSSNSEEGGPCYDSCSTIPTGCHDSGASIDPVDCSGASQSRLLGSGSCCLTDYNTPWPQPTS